MSTNNQPPSGTSTSSPSTSPTPATSGPQTSSSASASAHAPAALPHRDSTSSSSTVTVTSATGPAAASDVGTPTQKPVPASVPKSHSSARPESQPSSTQQPPPPPSHQSRQSTAHAATDPTHHTSTPRRIAQRIISPGALLFKHTDLPFITKQRLRDLENNPRKPYMDRRHPSSFQQLEKVSHPRLRTIEKVD